MGGESGMKLAVVEICFEKLLDKVVAILNHACKMCY